MLWLLFVSLFYDIFMTNKKFHNFLIRAFIIPFSCNKKHSLSNTFDVCFVLLFRSFFNTYVPPDNYILNTDSCNYILYNNSCFVSCICRERICLFFRRVIVVSKQFAFYQSEYVKFLRDQVATIVFLVTSTCFS